jgi:hypothetical protein
MSKLFAMTVISLGLVGCASTYPNDPVNLVEIERMKPDCGNADIQLRWLEHQTQLYNYNQERSEYERRWVAAAKNLTWELKSSCLRNGIRK